MPAGTDDIDMRETPRGVPYLERPLCEPVELRPGARVRIERVRQDADAGPSTPFLHFHDVHELVLFGAVAGRMYAHGRGWRLPPGSVAFIPSMRPHDFALEAGAHDWVLLQIDAASGDALARRPGLAALGDAFCALPDAVQRARIDMLAGWALRLPADAPQLPALLETLLYAVVEAPRTEGERQRQRGDRIERLRPAIEALRLDPAHAPSAEEAAALCAMSPAWFSRRFKRQVGLGWSDYVRTHRLHLASQRLLEGTDSVAAIATSLGFSSPSHFGELFLRRFGMTPAAHRKRGESRRLAGPARKP